MFNPIKRIAPCVLGGVLLVAAGTSSADIGLDMDSKYVLGSLSLNSWSNSVLFGVGLGVGASLTGTKPMIKLALRLKRV